MSSFAIARALELNCLCRLGGECARTKSNRDFVHVNNMADIVGVLEFLLLLNSALQLNSAYFRDKQKAERYPTDPGRARRLTNQCVCQIRFSRKCQRIFGTSIKL